MRGLARVGGSTPATVMHSALALFGLVVASLALGCTQPVATARYEEGLAAYRQGDYRAALAAWRRAAEDGDARAQFGVGLIYEDGRGVTQDFREAVRWYRQAAAHGEWKAETGLAWMYAIGEGVPQDYVRAQLWFALAAASSSRHDAAMQARLRDVLTAKMTPAQLAEAAALLRRCRGSDFTECD